MITPATAKPSELDAILQGAAVVVLADTFARAYLRVSGADATRWLNGMVSNSIRDLEPGHGCYAFLLNAQGRIEADAHIYSEAATPASFLVSTTADQIEHIAALFDRFIIMDDVELEPLALEGGETVFLLGPRAQEVWKSWAGDDAAAIEWMPLRHGAHPVREAFVATPSAGPVPQIELAPQRAAETIVDELTACGATPVSLTTLEAFRIHAGQPRYGVDIRNCDTAKDLPQETNQTQALHFNKGCYLGQEIVERIRSRGQVHRLLTKFSLIGDAPATLPTPLTVNGKAAGELTSVASVDGTLLALGYARREFLDAGSSFDYAGGTAGKRI